MVTLHYSSMDREPRKVKKDLPLSSLKLLLLMKRLLTEVIKLFYKVMRGTLPFVPFKIYSYINLLKEVDILHIFQAFEEWPLSKIC